MNGAPISSQPDQPAASVKLLQFDVPSRQESKEQEVIKLWKSKRLLVALFMFFEYFNSFILRSNLSIAIIEMTSNKTTFQRNDTIFKEPEFQWDFQTKSWILSLFSYGSFFAGFGGYLSSKYGGVTVAGIGILMTALLTMLSPVIVRTNMYAFAVGRIAEGMFETFAFTGICDVWSRWIPKNELPKVVSVVQSGYYVGAALTFPLCGFIAEYFGWPMIFYLTGFVGVLWSLLLFVYVPNDPQKDEKMSSKELEYIIRTTTSTDRKMITYPWKRIVTSKPLWALCCCKFAYSWAHFTIFFCFPLYIKDITNQSTAVVGLLSGIPNYVNLFVAPISGLCIDYLQNNRGFNSTKLQKSIVVIGYTLVGVLFAAVGFANFIVSMICFVLIITILSVDFNILQIMIVCLSPNHAGFIAALGSYWYSLSSILSSLAIGLIISKHTWLEWRLCFCLCGVLMVFAAIITVFYGTCEDQKWSSTEEARSIRHDDDH